MSRFVLAFVCLFMLACGSSASAPSDGVWEVTYSKVSGNCFGDATTGVVTIADGKVVANEGTPEVCALTNGDSSSYTFTCTDGELVTTETETFRVLDSELVTGVSTINISIPEDEAFNCEIKYVTFWVKK